jgi:putative ABC transport system permease protein
VNPIDVRERRRVLFLGDKIARDIFGESPAVGKSVLYGGSPFLVVGVLQEKVQNSSYNSRDEGRAYMPGTTFRALTGAKYVNNFIYQPVSPSQSEAVTEAVRATLARALRFDPTDKEALSVWDTAEEFKFLDVFFLSFRLFLGIVGCFTLVVGGIGVSNIMNVVVEERMKEIGIKMALGARQGWILRQFLLETILITAVGGAIGFAISFAICFAVPKLGATEFVGDPEISLSVAALTALVLGATGLLAGYFPAKEASRLDPVVAMKL